MSSAGGGRDIPIVELRSITKRFSTVLANDNVNFSLQPGAVHGVLGENGAGKTTLMRILYGLSTPDEGEILVDGRGVRIISPKDAIALGIGMVTQHFALVKPMTVTENIILGRTGGPVLDLKKAKAQVADAAQRYGIHVDPDRRLADLSVGEQQRVEILKALYRECRVLILDEPTAVLTPQEVRALFSTLDRLRTSGMSIVFINHKLPEVTEPTDRVTVLRHGSVVHTTPTPQIDAAELASWMVGRDVEPAEARTHTEPGETILEVSDLSAVGRRDLPAPTGLTFDVAAGEILGVAGVSGNGQTELAEVLSGMRVPMSGSMRVGGGTQVAGKGPKQVVAAGVGRIPEDRHEALVGDMSVAYNLVLEHLDEVGKGIMFDRVKIREHAFELIKRFSIKASPDDQVRTLSGGNIQKVLLARVTRARTKGTRGLTAHPWPRHRRDRVRPPGTTRHARPGYRCGPHQRGSR